ncbi:MAG TPA: hypothetical protein VM305_04525 [Candidatus Limnocylindrales bacterium]|nr:hypothetical protein [Candidatus Limnocylindrales bacterium]
MNKIPMSAVLLCVLALACGGSPASPQPVPTESPPAATPNVSPRPVTSPSAAPTSTAGGDRISHPTGASDVILQYEMGGGFVPLEAIITQVPQFTLYGDGTVIWVSQEGGVRVGLSGGTLPPLVEGTMDDEAIQALLRFALGQGRLAGARDHYAQDTCADCPTTTFRLHADGLQKVVTIDALGEVNEGPDALDRNGFNLLAQTLGAFDEQARNGVAGEVSHYDPAFYRVVLSEAQEGMGDFGAWPWPELALADFEPWEAGWQRRAVLTRDEVAQVADVPNGGVAAVLVEDPEGGLWTVGARALLPHEMEEAGR